MYFYLFSNCKLVKGACNSALIDLQRKNIFLIENKYFDILNNKENNKIENIINSFENKTEILEMFSFLRENELIFESKFLHNFKEIKNDFYYPFELSNAIIDYKNFDNFYLFVNQLDTLVCQYLQIRIFSELSNHVLEKIINILENETTNIISVEFLFANYDNNFLKIFNKSKKTTSVFFFNFENESFENINGINFIYTKIQMFSEKCCG